MGCVVGLNLKKSIPLYITPHCEPSLEVLLLLTLSQCVKCYRYRYQHCLELLLLLPALPRLLTLLLPLPLLPLPLLQRRRLLPPLLLLPPIPGCGYQCAEGQSSRERLVAVSGWSRNK